tara:strand:- start:227 stop:1570 length:1344 start_codon:yes stop_codon:yes gene_type:complete
MTVDELKSIFQSYCLKEAGSPEKNLFGLEYENFVMIPKKDDNSKIFEPLQMESDSGVFRILENLANLTKESKDPLEKIYEKGMLIELKSPAGTKITIEPGGQIELSDAPRNSLYESNESLQNYLKLLKNAIKEFGGKLLFQGVHPLHGLDEIPFFDKRRYQIMFPHMLKTGSLGQWMMKASSGVQVSIDYSSIEDMQRKFVFLNRLSPFLTALFANSPLINGVPCGYLSYRSHIWSNTDDSRTGFQKIFLSDKFRIEDYINWSLKVSPYHLMRNDEIVVTTNWSFQKLLDGENPDLTVTIEDWEEHLGMLFPDIRIKNILEIRVVDSVSPKYALAVPALIGALLYNENSFSLVQSMLMDLPEEEFSSYKVAAAKDALNADVNRTNFLKTGMKLMETALEELGSDEEKWLLPYFNNFTKEGKTPAEETLEKFRSFGEDPNKLLEKILL